MRIAALCLWAILVFKAIAGHAVSPASAQEGNLQADLESLIPKTEVRDLPTVVITPAFTTEEPKTKDELVKDVADVLSVAKSDIATTRRRSALPPGSSERARAAEEMTTTAEMTALVENLLPPAQRSLPVAPLSEQSARQSLEDAVLSIPMANIEAASKQSLLNVVGAIHSKQRRISATKPVQHPAVLGRPTAFKAVLPVGHSFRSNALRSNIDRQEDWVFASGLTGSLSVPVHAKDNITVSLGTTSRRFAQLSGANRDLGNAVIRYTHVYDKPRTALADKEGFALETTTLVSWDEGFTGQPVSFSGPAATWFLSGIPLGSQKCGTAKPVPCYSLDFEAATSYTWSNIAVLDNAAIGGSVKLSRAIPEHNLTLSGEVGVSGNVFPNERESRLDGGFTLAAGIEWQPRKDTLLSAGVSYGYNRSTISENDWDGYDLLPSIRFSTTFEN